VGVWRNIRSRLLLIVVLALAAGLALATLGFNEALSRSTARDANTLLRTRAETQLGLLQLDRTGIHLTPRRDDALVDSLVWVFDRTGKELEAPRARRTTDLAARSLAGSQAHFMNVPGRDTRLYAQPVTRDGQRLGTLVTAMSLAPYEQTQRTALEASVIFAVFLLVIVAVAVFLLLRAAFRPVSAMVEQAASWSEHDLDRRFGPSDSEDELAALAATLDSLLERIAASLRHERRLSAEISHELRTPLARAISTAEIALRRPRSHSEYREALESVLRAAKDVSATVETLLKAAREETAVRGIADADRVLRAAADGCAGIAHERNVSLDVARAERPLRVGVAADVAQRIVQPIVENACRYAATSVTAAIRRDGAQCVIEVANDGAGVESDERERIFEPGVRGSSGLASGHGAGLGLALARRLARAASGDVELAASNGQTAFLVRLPAA
jgi:signal transduction histidine kinase